MFLVTKEFVFRSFHHRKMRAVEIIRTEDCHDVHVLYKLSPQLCYYVGFVP